MQILIYDRPRHTIPDSGVNCHRARNIKYFIERQTEYFAGQVYDR